jgi:Amt family ammonium transporter
LSWLLPLQSVDVVGTAVGNVWVLVVCFLIFFMQPGFALLEAGQVRAKNVSNVLMKNMTDWVLGLVVYFLVGISVATIVGALTSGSSLDIAAAFSQLQDTTASGWIGWFYSGVFAMTAVTIVSGAVAERMKFPSYVFLAAVFTGIIYPIAQGLTWSGGALASGGFIGQAIGVGYLDFAGATVVHMVGGLGGLVAAKMVGPRDGRYDENGNSQPIPGHSMIFAVLGTLILAFGWYGFNVGTSGVVGAGGQLGRVLINTSLGMAGGALAAMAVSALWQGKPDPLWTANGLLAGLVAVTGAVPHVTWWGGLLLGVITGALVLPTFRWVVDSLKIDDVCGVFVVHGSSGAIGTILIPVFGSAGSGAAASSAAGGWTFLGADVLIMQIVGVAVLGTVTVIATMVTLGIAKAIWGLRVSDDEEEIGLDQGEHGVDTYPEFGSAAGRDAVGTDGGTDVRTDGGTADEAADTAQNGGENE